MKNKNKLVASLVIGASIVASFGTAFALYENATNGGKIDIGIGSVESHVDSDDKVTYIIGATKLYKDEALETEVASTDKLSPDFNKVYLSIPLSFEYAENNKTASAQDTVLGRFSTTVTIDDKLAGKGVVAHASLKGYKKANADGAEQVTYFTENKMSDFFNSTFGESEKTITKFIDTAVDKSSISCVMTLDFSTVLTADTFLDLSEIEKAFSVSLSWSGYSSTYTDFDSNLVPTAYIRGDKSDWNSYEDYQMVPNINAAYNIVEWNYKLLKGFSKIKVYDENETVLGSKWIYCKGVADNSGASIDSDSNAVLDKEKEYHVYYTRNETTDGKKGFYVGVDA